MGTELVTLQPDQFPAIDPNNDRVQLMMANLGGESLSVADFSRIKVPSGGATRWTIESAAGCESVEALEGVILHTTRRRAYWSNPNPTQAPPDCSSVDMITGHGNPGGLCENCPHNEFGSAKDGNGRGKACKETRLLFILRKGDVLPVVIAAPPASLKDMKKYLIDLSQIGLPYFGAVTQLTLSPEKNSDGIAFAKIKPKMVGKLDEASRATIHGLIKQYAATFEQVSAQFDEVDDEDTQSI